jgi:hypothetical protein
MEIDLNWYNIEKISNDIAGCAVSLLFLGDIHKSTVKELIGLESFTKIVDSEIGNPYLKDVVKENLYVGVLRELAQKWIEILGQCKKSGCRTTHNAPGIYNKPIKKNKSPFIMEVAL